MLVVPVLPGDHSTLDSHQQYGKTEDGQHMVHLPLSNSDVQTHALGTRSSFFTISFLSSTIQDILVVKWVDLKLNKEMIILNWTALVSCGA